MTPAGQEAAPPPPRPGYVDALTGEGTKVGILAALAAVDAIADDAPERYEVAWRGLWRPYAWSTEGLLAITGSPLIRAWMPRFLRRFPRVFDAALRVLAE